MRRTVLLALLLLGAAVFVFRDVGEFAFVNFDDADYVADNPSLRGAPGLGGVLRAFTTFHAANWLPLTWLSHAADTRIFGLNAGAHHLVSLALHAANTLLLFLLLRSLTGTFWRAAAAAAIFAFHPVQVESVAWVAERKTVLSALFGLLTLRAYLRHASRPGVSSLAAVTLLFTLGLLAKPMLVVLPPLLLLLDWWPLGRFGGRAPAPGAVRALLVEKVPLLTLALFSGAVTIAAQSGAHAVASLGAFTLPSRVGNAALSCVAYLGDLLLPRALTVFYPHPSGGLPWGKVALAALLLAAITFFTVRLRRSAPWALFGWTWYLVALLPVLGLVQVGSQARADRYLYLPLIGLPLAVVWGLSELARRRPRIALPLALAGCAALLLLAAGAHRQQGYWRDSRTLWTRALALHPESALALYQLSEVERESGRHAEQAALLRRLLAIDPRHERAANNLLIARHRLGEKPEPLLSEYRALLAVNPRNAKALQNYGYLLIESGRPGEAVLPLRSAIEIDPVYCTAINNLGRAYLQTGDRTLAAQLFERAAACDPENPKYRANLDLARQAGAPGSAGRPGASR